MNLTDKQHNLVISLLQYYREDLVKAIAILDDEIRSPFKDSPFKDGVKEFLSERLNEMDQVIESIG